MNDEGTPIPGHNLTELKAEIGEAVKQMEHIDAERLSLNEDAGAIRAKLEKQGIPRAVFAAAYRYYKMDPDKREGFDVAYRICRESVGLPVQEDLFDAKQDGETA